MVVAWLGTLALCTLFMMMMQHGGGSKRFLSPDLLGGDLRRSKRLVQYATEH